MGLGAPRHARGCASAPLPMGLQVNGPKLVPPGLAAGFSLSGWGGWWGVAPIPPSLSGSTEGLGSALCWGGGSRGAAGAQPGLCRVSLEHSLALARAAPAAELGATAAPQPLSPAKPFPCWGAGMSSRTR